MLKRILISTVILATATSTAAFAGAPYLGVGLGMQNSSFQFHDNSPSNNVINVGKRTPVAELFGGYGGLVSQSVYLGGELFINTANMNSSSTVMTATQDISNGAQVSLQTKASYGISFIPGWMLTDHTMAYLRMGVLRTQFAVSVNGATGYNGSTSPTQSGAEFGFGLQSKLSPNWELRGEYIYSTYNSFNSTALSSTLTRYHFKPTTDRVNFGLLYKFG
jgi:opacity protein-like surface antigen